jgi:hypothetical protein
VDAAALSMPDDPVSGLRSLPTSATSPACSSSTPRMTSPVPRPSSRPLATSSVPLSRPIGPWAILAVSGHGLRLVSVARDAWPTRLGSVWGHPAGWPVYTRRLVHRWVTGADLTEALPLG